MTKYKTYTRKEYLQWCKEHNVKSPLPEDVRNKFTLCGYPARDPYPFDPNKE